ncbi:MULTISPECIES: Maf family nucleotide pyrophosphatase [unclassified Robiginitalea]|uniref:Maf family nucleotide pyrophosphatase n=1 Tax=Robiginitalea TaxID=252306 RepID=UPI00234B5403|nr:MULTISPECIES: Maf family nucleotide pyrophosphatase [unclassified Robiginitalea]MDC6353892.1 Maf family nucleotide pyrophosphatase [Robiginitalea sp. PM2]MDC6374159.1 Maf family nucleotide pyrophosphatase [Robiginitalea sp. SP8]
MPRPDHQPQHLVLGSASPRRKSLLEAMGLEFEVRTQAAEERFPEDLKTYEITNYLSELKASVLQDSLPGRAVLLTADTIVCLGDEVLEKPAGEKEAREMLGKLSGAWHQVYTSVCLTAKGYREVFHARTDVRFTRVDPGMLTTYLHLGNPMDKAGGYGIQEWIGLVGVEAIRGSYTNVVGLPTQLVYQKLRDMVRRGF